MAAPFIYEGILCSYGFRKQETKLPLPQTNSATAVSSPTIQYVALSTSRIAMLDLGRFFRREETHFYEQRSTRNTAVFSNKYVYDYDL
jgi:hypothetical protein